MIKKLKNRIFLLIMISLLTVILGVILLFAVFNYRNTINSRVSMIDRFVGGKKDDFVGIYNIEITNNQISKNSDISQNLQIEEYALKLSKKDSESGIIGNYIYKVRKIDSNNIHITLMEDANAVLHVKEIIGFSIALAILSIVMIYIIAKKLSKAIVKPVEETFEKQKQFISDASHELKTPLAVIEANADVLENEVGRNKWLGYIQNEITSMDKLINELLLLTKIENVDSIKEYKVFDVSKQVQITFSMFESIAYEKNVKLKSNIKENIMLNGDKEDIKHILSTLIDNAIKHTEPKKEVIVELSKDKNEIIIQVKNMGEPIPDHCKINSRKI